MTTQISVALFKAESWEQLKEMLVGMTKALIGKEPDWPDSCYQEKYADLQAERKARADAETQSQGS